jgi:hypothetical protein
MPVKLNVSISKMIGRPDFGSLGASCAVEVELPCGAIDDLEAFRRQARNVYAAATQAVNGELARQQQANPTASESGNGHALVGNGGANGQGNGGVDRNGQNGHAASEKQLEYARQLARAIGGLGIRRLEALAARAYGKPLAALTSRDASGLIETLRNIKAGVIDLHQVMEEATL